MNLKNIIIRCAAAVLALLIIVKAGSVCREKLFNSDNEAENNISEAVSETETPTIPKTGETTEAETLEETTEDSAFWFVPQADDCLLSNEEEERLQSEALAAAESVGEIYKDSVIENAPKYNSGIGEFTEKQRKAVAEKLGSLGVVCAEEKGDMKNPEGIEEFYADYLNNRPSAVTVFEIQNDGLIGALTFIYRNGRLQTYYVGVRWLEGGAPEIQGTNVSNVREINLTEKGYFIYAYEETMAHTSMRRYWRIRPLSDECKMLTEKYISGLSYVNYNMLVTNWNADNIEDILMPEMFEDIYRIYSGESFKTENGKIPAEEFEKIMSIYFPVSSEQLRRRCDYDAAAGSYPYEAIRGAAYPPFGEVVDYRENTDGTITLFVDGVWCDYNSDLAFKNEITIKPFDDGTFRYLSNSIEEKELPLPRSAGTEK